jgi:hypothetical protein
MYSAASLRVKSCPSPGGAQTACWRPGAGPSHSLFCLNFASVALQLPPK